MGDNSRIEWTEATWNPVTGCTKVSAGCKNCYAERMANRLQAMGQPNYRDGFAVTLHPDALEIPLRWKRPRRIFVCSMGDLFHESVPDEFIAAVFCVMAACPQHTFQVLTKRAERMRSYMDGCCEAVHFLTGTLYSTDMMPRSDVWILPNVWPGVTCENQEQADARIPHLLRTPAALRWVSYEPAIGPITFTDEAMNGFITEPDGSAHGGLSYPRISWIVAGGETGPGARPAHPQWFRDVRDQCAEAGVPFLFKQWGDHAYSTVEHDPNFSGGRAFNHPNGGRMAAIIRECGSPFARSVTRSMRAGDKRADGTVMLDNDTVAVRVGKKRAGRLLDGVLHDAYPEVQRG